jgi:glycosyltransferase involved in cell wall biosynthesis
MNVAMIDLLTQAPFYDRYLSEAIASAVSRFSLYAVRFHYEPDYFEDITFNRSPGLIDCVSGFQIQARPLRQAGRVIEYVLNWLYLLYKFRRQPPDVIHIQWLPLLSRIDWELRIVDHLRQSGFIVIYTVHNYLPHELLPHHHQRYRRLYTSVDHLIVHTRADWESLTRDPGVSREKISVIPQGPAFSEQVRYDQDQARTELGLEREDFVFLMLGVIRPYKGIEETICALADVVRTYPRCKLVVAGQALDKGYLRRLQALASELGVGSHVQWCTRYIHSSKIGLFHAAANVVLFPYRQISQSGAFLTAAALGKCTLTTKVGGLAEIVQDGVTGVQVASCETATLADGLQRCIKLSPDERARMGDVLQTYVRHCCNWNLIAKRTVNTYQRVLRNHQCTGAIGGR